MKDDKYYYKVRKKELGVDHNGKYKVFMDKKAHDICNGKKKKIRMVTSQMYICIDKVVAFCKENNKESPAKFNFGVGCCLFELEGNFSVAKPEVYIRYLGCTSDSNFSPTANLPNGEGVVMI